MNTHKLSSERGQSLVLVALLFLAFAAILALVLDGGSAYAARRQAQNAADAGALAGASFMCEHRDAAGGVTKAEDFAVLNGAVDPPDVYANLNTGSVVVTATVQKDTFFAGLIGVSQVSPRAVAEAQCRPPVGMGILPVAWSCRETVVEGEHLPGIDCAQVFGPCNDLSCIYVVMDTVKVKIKDKCKPFDPDNPDCYTQQDIVCDILQDDNDNGSIDPEEYSIISFSSDPKITIIDCDIDDDGINELKAGGDRSWLDLNGPAGGANELKDWLTGGYADPISTHTWLPNASGSIGSAFNAVIKQCQDEPTKCLVGKEVVLPVFDKFCNGDPTVMPLTPEQETKTYCEAGTSDNLSLIKQSTNNYHVISFSKFHVTCLQKDKKKGISESGSNNECPGHAAAVGNNSIDENDKTIEGYFVDEQIFGYGGSGNFIDTGTFVVVLVR